MNSRTVVDYGLHGCRRCDVGARKTHVNASLHRGADLLTRAIFFTRTHTYSEMRHALRVAFNSYTVGDDSARRRCVRVEA